jgi:outer membrane protein OmpA-like peptidoglycan-associated protein
MSKAKQTKDPNSDLVQLARGHRAQIIRFHDEHGGTGGIVVLDFRRLKLHAFAFDNYKATLRPESQARLDEVYQRAVAKNRVLVVVWDSASRRLATTSIRRA